jgi:hypothetical protein
MSLKHVSHGLDLSIGKAITMASESVKISSKTKKASDRKVRFLKNFLQSTTIHGFKYFAEEEGTLLSRSEETKSG